MTDEEFELRKIKAVEVKLNGGAIQLAPISCYFAYTDHYRGNGCGTFIFTDNDGREMNNGFTYHCNDNMDDRGVQRLIKFENGTNHQLYIYRQLFFVCKNYREASAELKKFKEDKEVFENTYWFAKRAAKVKPFTIERKKKGFYDKQKKNNALRFKRLYDAKLEATCVLSDLGLTPATAYLFN